ncbi:hypothetical protein QF034_000167 [Streptomyces africanus]|uniref:Transposase n=1 Tax=Streptomyces africanus TaxID=231024 RepID=A0ABU0QEW6_9ACTN|nr:hypothetical protein [Streptomyces africanus]MDQ0745936.1 hypothetical protein [Streptomyces africanus]
MLWLLSEKVAALHRHWGQVEPHLGSLREPFDRHLTEPIGWIQDFPSFSRLVTEWGDVVSQATRREWAIIGLRCRALTAVSRSGPQHRTMCRYCAPAGGSPTTAREASRAAGTTPGAIPQSVRA